MVDNVIESVSFGLEQNDFKFYQRRLAEVKYLGELYNYRMLEHPVIFEIMYKILTFGHGMLAPHARAYSRNLMRLTKGRWTPGPGSHQSH